MHSTFEDFDSISFQLQLSHDLLCINLSLDLSITSNNPSTLVPSLFRVKWSGVSIMVEAFSLLAVGTSLIGTLLAFFEFFKEQLNNFTGQFSSTQLPQVAFIPLVREKLIYSSLNA